MKILFLTFYFEPDLSAGSFRNTSLFKALKENIKKTDTIEVITTSPNRYGSYTIEAQEKEHLSDNVIVNRINIPKHQNGILGQIKTFKSFYFQALKSVKNKEYDLVYASSSRLFTAFLGARIANKKKAKLYLDIRDIFRETILDVYKNKLIRIALNTIITPIENYTFKSANHINLVSKGFESYFKKYKSNFSYFTNGIDSIFLNRTSVVEKKENQKKVILYAGNIGEGQGLHIIIPTLAKALEKHYKFKVIGDGGVKDKLLSEIKKQEVTNVEITPPVVRLKLLEEYDNADFLFMHLNKHDAFKRVLPSKLFEYGAFNKPMIAGVSGYASTFLKENVTNALVFEPGDYVTATKLIMDYEYKLEDRKQFKIKFSREQINVKMSKSILELGK
ncbi:glycosyltransferase family 4 protein [Pontimicrobium sp. MEBiC01747]